jgi:hypothetical protein
MRWSRNGWSKIVAEFETSGETHVGFCESRAIALHSFRLWLYRLRKERALGTIARSATKAVALVPVRVRAASVPQVAPADVVEIAVGGGALVRVRVGADVRYVAELAAALASRC